MTPAEAVTTVQAVVRSCPRVPFMTCGSKLSTATVRGMWMVVPTASSSNPYVNLVRPFDPEGGRHAGLHHLHRAHDRRRHLPQVLHHCPRSAAGG